MIVVIIYFFIALIQGVTEVFPISSSGHTTLFFNLFELDIKNTTTLLIFANAGSFFALVVHFKSKWSPLIMNSFNFIFRKDTSGKSAFFYILKLFVSTIPAIIFGLLIQNNLPSSGEFVSLSLIITSIALFVIWIQRKSTFSDEISFFSALTIGFFQAFALFPGISRSGFTLLGGTSRKIKLKKTLEFSFLSYCLISFPITLFGFFQVLSSSLSNVFYLFFVLIISFFATLLSLKIFFKFVSFKNILYFSIYCFFIGSLGLLFFFFS